MTKRVVLLLLCIAIVSFLNADPAAGQDDWPQYMGPNRDNTVVDAGIYRTWPKDGPEVLWTASVSPGYGGPVIKDGNVYLLDRDDGNRRDILFPASSDFRGSRKHAGIGYACSPG